MIFINKFLIRIAKSKLLILELIYAIKLLLSIYKNNQVQLLRNCEMSSIYSSFEIAFTTMTKAQAKQFNHEQLCVCHSTLAIQEALLMYYSLMHPIVSVDFFKESQISRKKGYIIKCLSYQYQLRACLNIYPRIIDQTKAQNCLKVLQQSLMESGVQFKQKKQITSRQIQNIKMEEKVLNHLFYFLKLNYQYKILCRTNQDIFSFTYIAKIFKCNQEIIKYFNDIYCKNNQNIQEPYCLEVRLIYFLFVIKLRLVSKQLQTSEYPKEQEIQTQFLMIRKFYMNQYNQGIKNSQYKDRFSVLCVNENYIYKLKLSKRKELLNNIKNLLDQKLKKQRQDILIQKIAQRFNIKKSLIINEVKIIKKGQKTKTDERQDKVKQLIDQINYQIWKQPRQSMSKIFLSIPQLGSSLDDFFQQHCIPYMNKLKRFQRISSRRIHHYIISQLMKRQEVLFIDYSIFYQQQINDYNILLDNLSQIKPSKSRFVPVNDAYLYLITGITSKRILFYSIKNTLSIFTYISSIQAIFEQYKQYLPRVIVLNVTMGWTGQQWQRLSNLRTIMQSSGFLVLFSFNQQYDSCNINFKISNILRYIILSNCRFCILKEQLRKCAKQIIHLFINQGDFQIIIQRFFKNEYRYIIPRI